MVIIEIESTLTKNRFAQPPPTKLKWHFPETQGTMVSTYRGYEIWFWPAGEKLPSDTYSAENGPCSCTGYKSTRSSIESKIDSCLDTTKVYKETYKGIEIYYQDYYATENLCDPYSATVSGQTRYFPNFDKAGCKAWIDTLMLPQAKFLADPVFPTEANLAENKVWGAMVQNAGSDGDIRFSIGSVAGNPGNIEVYCMNTEKTYTIQPGQALNLHGPVNAGKVLGGTGGLSGTMNFKAEGTYSLLALASHLEAAEWVLDETRTHTVQVGEVIPPPPPDKPKATLEDFTFPIDALMDTFKPWSAKIHNIGGKGGIGIGIVNPAGNPGNTIIEHDGQIVDLSPGQYYRIWAADKPNCTRLTQSGKVKFATAGTYAIKIWAMHEDGGTWYYDEEELITVTVTEPTNGDENGDDEKTFIELLLEWWNGLEGYQKALTFGIPAISLLLLTRPRYPYPPPPY